MADTQQFDPNASYAPAATPAAALPNGMLQQGNIDVNHRPVVNNEDGSQSTIFSMTVPTGDGKWALIPSIANGKFLTPNGKIPDRNNKAAMQQLEDAATAQYKKTGQHLGIFNSADAADGFAEKTHSYAPTGGKEQVFLPPGTESAPPAIAGNFDPNSSYASAEAQAPTKPWYQRGWEDLWKSPAQVKKEVPQVNKETSEAGLENASRFAAPGSTTPLSNAISEAQAASALTAPRAIGESGGLMAAGSLGEMASGAIESTKGAISRASGVVRDVTGRLVRDPDVLEYPKTAKSLRAPVKAVANIGKMVGGPEIVNALTPAHPDAPQGPYAKIPVRIPRNVIAARAAAAAKAATEATAGAVADSAGATVYPEPRTAGPSERPGAMYSVPRDQLPGLAASGAPGAADVLRATGQPVIYEPKGGTGYGGPRQAAQTPAEFAAQPSAAVSQPSAALATTAPAIDHAALAQGAGLEYRGSGSGLATFHDPTTNNTFSLAEGKVSAEALAAKKAAQQAPATGTGSLAEFLRQKRTTTAAPDAATNAILNRMDKANIESNRLDLGRLSSLEKHYVADTMDSPNYAKLSDAAKKQLLLAKIGGHL